MPPPGLVLAEEGSLEQKHALACLDSALSVLQAGFWQHGQHLVGPDQLVQHLQGSSWAAVRRQDSALMRGLLHALQVLAQSCLPCLQPPHYGIDLVDEEDGQQPGATEACKTAVLLCLRLLLVQLPCSAQVPLLMRGLALEVCCGVVFEGRQHGTLCTDRLLDAVFA